MNVGALLVVGSFGFLAASLGTSWVAWRKNSAWARLRAQRFLWLSTLFFGAALLVLAAAFLRADFSYQYVWAYTHVSYPWWQKLAGVWAGREGSLMLWMFWMLLSLSIADAIGRRKETRLKEAGRPFEEAPSRSAARVVALATLVVFFVIFLTMEPFAAARAGNDASGRGLNPQLVTVLMAIHPPILFTGYALTLIPFSAAAGYMMTGDRRWTEYCRPWAYLNLFALTLGVGLGGLWAYIALGWGGYWAWDPVEVASTVPWVIVAMFLHAQLRHAAEEAPAGASRRGEGSASASANKEFPVAAPLIGYLTFMGSLFATFVTRAGGLWVSVHSFLGERFSPSAMDRLRFALVDGESAGDLFHYENGGYFAMLVGGLALGLFLLWRHTKRVESQQAAPALADGGEALPRTLVDRVVDRLRMPALFTAGVMLFALALVVILTLMLVGINGFASDDARIHVFETRVGVVVLGMMTVLGFTLSSLLVKRRAALAVTAGALALSLVGALLFEEQRELAGAIPVLTLALAASGSLVAKYVRRRRWNALRLVSTHTVHLGVALLLLGYGFSSTVDEEFPVLELTEGQTRSYKDIDVTLDEIETRDVDGDGDIDVVRPMLSVAKGGDALGGAAPEYEYFAFMDYYRPQVSILSLWTTDVYLTPRGFYDSDQGWVYSNLPLFDQGKHTASGDVSAVAIEVKLLPFVRLLWVGWGLMLLGIALRLVAYAWEADQRTKRLLGASVSPDA